MKKWIAVLCVAVLCVTGAGTAGPPTDGFQTTLSLGLTLNEGNTDSSLANVSLMTERRNTEREISAGAEYLYGQQDDRKNVDKGRLQAGVKELVGDPFFLSADVGVMRDRIADIDYRAILATGVGYFFVKTEVVSLSLDIGPAYVWEKVADGRDDYFGARAAQRYTHTLSETARLWQSLEYVAEAEDFDNYLLTGEAGIEAAINARLSLRTAYRISYDHEPAEDTKSTDHQLVTSVVVRL